MIRGDLLKRYPNTFIYAQKATWGSGPARQSTRARATRPASCSSRRPTIRGCAFRCIKARVAPDIHFVGFDLTLDEARGDPRLEETAAARAVVGRQSRAGFSCFRKPSASHASVSTSTRRSNHRRRSGTTSPGPNLDLAAVRRSTSAKPFRRAVPVAITRKESRGAQCRRYGLHPVPGAGHGRGAWPRHAEESADHLLMIRA